MLVYVYLTAAIYFSSADIQCVNAAILSVCIQPRDFLNLSDRTFCVCSCYSFTHNSAISSSQDSKSYIISIVFQVCRIHTILFPGNLPQNVVFMFAHFTSSHQAVIWLQKCVLSFVSLITHTHTSIRRNEPFCSMCHDSQHYLTAEWSIILRFKTFKL